MTEQEILDRVRSLVAEEHDLRTRLAAGEVTEGEEHDQLEALEKALDQAWDLLRQRRARQEFGQNPDTASERDATEVEGYLQ
jgi:hypothetical protein